MELKETQMNSKEPQGSSCMTCGQLFLLFCDDSGFSHDQAHFSRRIDDIEDEIYREKLKIKKVSDELNDTFDDMLDNY